MGFSTPEVSIGRRHCSVSTAEQTAEHDYIEAEQTAEHDYIEAEQTAEHDYIEAEQTAEHDYIEAELRGRYRIFYTTTAFCNMKINGKFIKGMAVSFYADYELTHNDRGKRVRYEMKKSQAIRCWWGAKYDAEGSS